MNGTTTATVVITGAGTGIGALTARSLAAAGHTVYATMRDPERRNTARAKALRDYADETGTDLRVIELDVTSSASAAAAAERVVAERGGIDVLVHNAAHLYYGITEGFTPEQVLAAYDVNAVGALRVNRAVLPHMRAARSGLLVWVGSGTSRIVPPFLAPYTAAKAAMDSLAESVAWEVARYGIETTIVMPGVFTDGTEHFPNAATPPTGPIPVGYDLVAEFVAGNEAATRRLFPPGTTGDPQIVADAITTLLATPAGQRPRRIVADASDFGAEPVNGAAEEQRLRLARRMGITELLEPAEAAPPGRR
jgi:NAD(P)-dependent dehydrogenase (short-subunit alcohol dehydrogenase family)